ncbi:MAG: hypothetical protein WC455_20360 [Dehalococcoidia bacterium]
MKATLPRFRRAGTPVRSKGWLDSCDWCDSQEEGQHYCLLHSRMMKNMDTHRCSDWTPCTRWRGRRVPESAPDTKAGRALQLHLFSRGVKAAWYWCLWKYWLRRDRQSRESNIAVSGGGGADVH